MSTETGTGKKPNGLSEELGRLQSDWDRQERAEPPELLDQAVLNAARRDLEPIRRKTRLGWISGFATAGIAVVTLSVVLLQETPRPPLPVPLESPAEEVTAERRAEKGKAVSSPARAMQKQDMQAESPVTKSGAAAAFEAAPAAAAAADAETMNDSVTRLRMAQQPKEELLESADMADSSRSAQEWLQHLLQLHDQGEDEELARQLQAFREAYPDYPLPEALQD